MVSICKVNRVSLSSKIAAHPDAGHLQAFLSKFWRYLTRREHFLGPPSIALRFKFFLTGAVLPVGCVALMIAEGDPSTRRLWQSGELSVYMALLVKWRAQVAFLPLIAFHIVALCCWLLHPPTIHYLVVRMGIYFGIPLAAQYLVLLSFLSTGLTLVCSLIFGPLLALAVFLVDISIRSQRWPRSSWMAIGRTLLGWTWIVIAIATIAASVFAPEPTWNIAVFVAIFAVLGAPALSLITYLRASIMVSCEHHRLCGRERRSLLFWLLAFQAVAATWLAGWKIAVDVMLYEYSKLPTTPPNCYLSAASACLALSR